MRKKLFKSASVLTFATAVALTGCGNKSSDSSSTNSTDTETGNISEVSSATDSTEEDDSDSGTTTLSSPLEASVELKESDLDTSTDGTQIVCTGSNISIDGPGADIDDSTITISKEGTYVLSGSLDNGQIVIDTTNEEKVHLVLNGVSISSSTSSVIYVKQADKVIITLADGTTNFLKDAETYVYSDDSTDEPCACIYSKDDLTFNGAGTLNVSGNYDQAICSKDDLKFVSGSYNIESVTSCIKGKDSVQIADGTFILTAGSDGIKATNSSDTTLGYIVIDGGTFNISATDKAIQSYTTTILNGGEFTLSSVDDSLHSNGFIVINEGDYTLTSEDDAMHADVGLYLNGGTIDVISSYEGYEASHIEINGGTHSIIAADDGINVAGGTDGSGMGGFNPMSREQAVDTSDESVDTTDTDTDEDALDLTVEFSSYVDNALIINDGSLNISSSGDGLDSNGSLEINGGSIFVEGPEDNGNGTLDYTTTAVINGGTYVGTGSSGMAQGFDSNSTQYSFLIGTTNLNSADYEIQDSSGNVLIEFSTSKISTLVTFSSSDIVEGETYTVYANGEPVGTVAISSICTWSNANEGMSGMNGNPGGGEMPQGGGGFGNMGNDGTLPFDSGDMNGGATPPDNGGGQAPGGF